MHPTTRDVWDVALTPPPWDPSKRLRSAARLWRAHGYAATWCSAVIAVHMVQEFAGGTAESPVEVEVPIPTGVVSGVLGNEGDLLLRSSFGWIAGLMSAVQVNMADPGLEQALHEMSNRYEGRAVYAFNWWTCEALAQLADGADEDAFLARVARVERQVAEFASGS